MSVLENSTKKMLIMAIDDGASGITGVADSAKSLAGDMEDITGRMDTNKMIVEELKKQMDIFADF